MEKKHLGESFKKKLVLVTISNNHKKFNLISSTTTFQSLAVGGGPVAMHSTVPLYTGWLWYPAYNNIKKLPLLNTTLYDGALL